MEKNHKQKRKRLSKEDRHRKKVKSDSVLQDNVDAESGLLEDIKLNFLDKRTIREELVVLGCITYIGKSSIRISLPGCLHGTVEAMNISNGFTEAIEASIKDPDVEVPSIDSVVKLGMVLPCKVLKVEHDISSSKKTKILLSIRPEDVYGNLTPSLLYPKMCLFASVRSMEDHGYVVDVGIEMVQGFLPKGSSDDKGELKIGQLIPVYVEKILSKNKKSAKVMFYALDSSRPQFPEVSLKVVKLHSIMPGTKITADVIKKHKHYAVLKYFDFGACASLFYSGYFKRIEIGDQVKGTVLYICPVTGLIHLSLDDLPCPADFLSYFGMKKHEIVNSPKFLNFYKTQAIFRFDRRKFGFINVWDLPSKEGGVPTMPSSAITDIQKARIVALHFMDNVVQLSAKPSLLAQNIILRENIKAGDVYEVTVEKHFTGGMFVHICPGVLGFVRKLHMSDAYITKPEQLYPSGSTVKCRVLCNDGAGKIYLTCKKSMVQLDEDHILSSYWEARSHNLYKGVVVNVSKEYIVVLFFNEIKGILTRENMSLTDSNVPLNSVYFVGQTITCEVLHCNPREEKLNLSHKIDQANVSVKTLRKLQANSENIVSKKKQVCKDDYVVSDTTDASEDNKEESETINLSISSDTPCTSLKISEAVIRKVKSHQLDISLKNGKGRVHITELGCKIEGMFPLKEFSQGQKINVFTIGEFQQKRKNFLAVSHINFSTFKECTLKYPPRPKDFAVGNSLIGFVKEVYDIYATVWLSPTKFGVLDYLHYSEKPKVIRKLRHDLKVGFSVNVSVLDIKQDRNDLDISLSKIDYFTPEVGKNIAGLVQVACPTRGLILKLPFGYHGNVAITDLTDVYEPVQNLFRRYQKLKFLKCHVLKVDHDTKYCLLSLRMSRLYQKRADSDSFCPEVTADTIEEGNRVKGFVKHLSHSTINVLIGREIEGKVYLHECNSSSCSACKSTKQIVYRYPAGSVIDVIIEGKSSPKELILSLPELKTKKNIIDALPIEEDINFDIPALNDPFLTIHDIELDSMDF